MIAPDELMRIARAAGERILEVYRSGDFEARAKADASPVTAADLAAHESIVEELARATPQIPVISEESADDLAALAALLARGDPLWLVDPLDGTRDFIARTGEFTVNIALIARGRPRVGCVHAPARDETYLAVEGHGATMARGEGALQQIRSRPIGAPPHVLVSRQHHGDEADIVAAAFPGCTVSHVGSSLKYCMIARGEADAAFRRTPTMLWDTAAAECVLIEAGGRMLGVAGDALSYAGPACVNPPFVALGDSQSPAGPWLRLLRD